MVYYYVAIERLANIYIIFVKRYTEMWQECVMPDSEVYEDRGYNLFLPKIKRISTRQLNHQNDNRSLSDKKKQVFSLAIQHILFIFALVTGVV
ncbi:hypothetical protein HMPREF0658_2258 [Hoylesella marshii DSM 16973 = JCM 13450]|uniref:Uncharacterized protein n=1 Tax=Hoylesella marshii DSM 16973 = JCM 13450 TaxID=862515 RepID=E0NVQ3_9BACT|nr:hypothetical protein HMPREF0658_2258 [Hoylesella marshii DSM 16973 = JCM 13450]